MAVGNPPPPEVFADVTRRITEQHDTWDAPHQFLTLHWDGERVSYGTVAMITTDIHPDAYPGLMAEIAQKEIFTKHDSTAYAYALQIEGWAAIPPGPQASATERLQFEADRRGRRFHQRPDAIEIATTWCADVHGRLWSAVKRRDQPGIEETFWPSDRAVDQARGQLVKGLLGIAYATGVAVHGLPVPGEVRR